LQIKATKTLKYDKHDTTILWSEYKILNIPDLFKLLVAEFI